MALARTQYTNRKNFQGFAKGKRLYKHTVHPAERWVPNPSAANGNGGLHFEDGELVPKLRMVKALRRASKEGKDPHWKGQMSPAQEWLHQKQLGGFQ